MKPSASGRKIREKRRSDVAKAKSAPIKKGTKAMAAKYLNAKSGKEVLDFAKAHGAKLVDFKFCYIPGT